MIDTIIDVVKKNPTVTLTLLTALSYFCTFQYESGICTYYNIPISNIEIGITNMLIFASIIAVIFPHYLVCQRF